jgi:hypothetical protein
MQVMMMIMILKIDILIKNYDVSLKFSKEKKLID